MTSVKSTVERTISNQFQTEVFVRVQPVWLKGLMAKRNVQVELDSDRKIVLIRCSNELIKRSLEASGLSYEDWSIQVVCKTT